MPAPIINCHAHVFTIDHVPDKFIPGWLAYAIRTKALRQLIISGSEILARMLPGVTAEEVKRYARFIELMVSQEELQRPGQDGLLRILADLYPPDTCFALHSMDMAFMGCGTPPATFEKQLTELAEIKKNREWKDRVFPFVAVDPRRSNHLDLVKKCIEEHSFTGVKLYPPLGYWPCDQRLMGDGKLYDYCHRNQIPIMTHASEPTAIRFRGKADFEASFHPITGKPVVTSDTLIHARILTNPDEYRPVLNQYPKLKLCLAHFGGAQAWSEYLKRPWSNSVEEDKKGVDGNWLYKVRRLLGEDYPNVCTDVSFTWAYPRFTPLLKMLLMDPVIRQRILFGTDFYMVELKTSEREASIEFRYSLGEEDYAQIAQINPLPFLIRAGSGQERLKGLMHAG